MPEHIGRNAHSLTVGDTYVSVDTNSPPVFGLMGV